MNIPRQPFLGLALMAALGIGVAGFFPIAASQWWLRAIIFAVLAIPLLCWPNLTSTYLLVGCGFFLLHNFRIGLKRTKILFVSDSGCATEKSLLASRSDLRSDVLVKGQHHSGNSGSDVFLDAVRPRLVVATSRDFPQQERISDEWAGQVRARNIKLFRQDETGAVELEFGEREWQARAYLTGEIFRSANR